MTKAAARDYARFAAAALFIAGLPGPALAQLAVSSNDNKEVQVDGVRSVVPNAPPDTATIIDLGVTPPKIIAELNVPGSWSAPPQSVAITPDESLALVANSTKIDPANPGKTTPDNTLTVIDLKARPPVVIGRLATGNRAAGISINRAGTLALVANRGEGTVSVFAIEGKNVTAVAKVELCARDCAPSLPVFTPDGKSALVTRNNDHKVSVLAVDGKVVTYTKVDIAANLSPYGLEITPKGDVAIVANIVNGPAGGTDTIGVIDLKLTPPRLVDAISVGLIPEGIALSPDGTFLAADVMNGSNLPKSSPFFNDYGLLKIYRLAGTRLSPVTEAKVGHWCEGIVWSNDQRTLLVQCMVEKRILVFRFDGTKLKAAGSLAVNGGPAGIRVAGR